jgi:hypothetical protein
MLRFWGWQQTVQPENMDWKEKVQNCNVDCNERTTSSRGNYEPEMTILKEIWTEK